MWVDDLDDRKGEGKADGPGYRQFSLFPPFPLAPTDPKDRTDWFGGNTSRSTRPTAEFPSGHVTPSPAPEPNTSCFRPRSLRESGGGGWTIHWMRSSWVQSGWVQSSGVQSSGPESDRCPPYARSWTRARWYFFLPRRMTRNRPSMASSSVTRAWGSDTRRLFR
jgi:hypothetical protein